jgi:hypothetical protein
MDSVSIQNYNENTGMLRTRPSEEEEVELHEIQEKTPNTSGGLAFRLLLHASALLVHIIFEERNAV